MNFQGCLRVWYRGAKPLDSEIWLYFTMPKNKNFSIVFTNFKNVDTFNPPPFLELRVKKTPLEVHSKVTCFDLSSVSDVILLL